MYRAGFLQGPARMRHRVGANSLVGARGGVGMSPDLAQRGKIGTDKGGLSQSSPFFFAFGVADDDAPPARKGLAPKVTKV